MILQKESMMSYSSILRRPADHVCTAAEREIVHTIASEIWRLRGNNASILCVLEVLAGL